MATNVTQIAGATEIGHYYRNYTWASALTDLPALSRMWVTDLNKPAARGPSGTPLKFLMDASGASNLSAGTVPRANSNGEMQASLISDDGSEITFDSGATGADFGFGSAAGLYSFQFTETTSVTASVRTMADILVDSTGSAADGFGGKIIYSLSDDGSGTDPAGAWVWEWADVSALESKTTIQVNRGSGLVDMMEVGSNFVSIDPTGTGLPVIVGAASGLYRFEVVEPTTATADTATVARLLRDTTGAASDGFGGRLDLAATDALTVNQTVAQVRWDWDSASAEFGQIGLWVNNGSTTAEAFAVRYEGSDDYVYQFGTTGNELIKADVSAGDLSVYAGNDIRLYPSGYELWLGDGSAQDYVFKFNSATPATLTFDNTDQHFEFSKEIRQTDTSWEDYNIDISVLGTGTTTPTTVTVASTNVKLRAFSTNDEVHGSAEIPHAYKLGGDQIPHIHFMPDTAPTGTDYVKWELEVFIVDTGGTVTTATTIDTGDIAVDTQWKLYTVDFGSVPVTHPTLGGQVGFRLKRVAATGDAFAGDLAVMTFGTHYEVDSLGSDEVTTKG